MTDTHAHTRTYRQTQKNYMEVKITVYYACDLHNKFPYLSVVTKNNVLDRDRVG